MKKLRGETEVIVDIRSEQDIVVARQKVRDLVARLGFSSVELTMIATVISELSRNIVEFAKRGEIFARVLNVGNRIGIEIIARDLGPGIPDIEKALQDGYSTIGGLGLGLPGVKRMMDEFEITSEVGKGTTVMARKWRV